MTARWLYAWGFAAVSLGGASLIVPLYIVALGGGAFALGILFATASFVGVPGALVFGRLADRTGRRRIFVIAAIAFVTAMLGVIPAVDAIPLVIVANAVLWFAFAAALPVLTLLVVSETPEDQWTNRIAQLNKFQGVGWALGLLLGFVIITGGSVLLDPIAATRAFFIACAVSSGLGLAVAIRTLPADGRPEAIPAPARVRRRLRDVARFNVRGASFPFTPGRVDLRNLHYRTFIDRFTPSLALYFLAVFLFFAGFGAFFAPLPAYLTDVGLSDSEIFGLYFVLNVGAAVFFGQAATLAGKYDVTLVHAGGLAGRGIAIPVVAVIGLLVGGSVIGLGASAVVFVAIGITWAIIVVTAGTLVTRLAPAIIRGEALGVYSALSALAGGVGGLLGGWIAGLSYAVAFTIAGGFVLVGAGVVMSLHRRITSQGVESPAIGD